MKLVYRESCLVVRWNVKCFLGRALEIKRAREELERKEKELQEEEDYEREIEILRERERQTSWQLSHAKKRVQELKLQPGQTIDRQVAEEHNRVCTAFHLSNIFGRTLDPFHPFP